jgi:streptogramin lyase
MLRVRRTRRRSGWPVACLLALAFGLAACTASGESSSLTSAPTQESSSSISATSSTEPSIATTQTSLPKMQTPVAAGGAHIKATTDADWTLVAFGKAWIKGLGKGIGIFDARSGRFLGSAAVPQGPCAAMDAGFGAVWTATCDEQGVSRIDAETGRVTGHVAITVPITGESSIGAGEGGIWAISDAGQCSQCRIVEVDPQTMKVTKRFPIPDGASAVRAGLGGVWLTYFDLNEVVRVDPINGAVIATIPVAEGPRFFDVGGGGVWVMAQAAGALCHVDPKTNRLVTCVQIDPTSVQGGDLTVGAGSVWFRGSAELVAQVDPATGKVVARFGPAQGSGSASAGSNELWISAHDVASLYRVPLK